MNEAIKVYIKVNDKHEITEINSDIFIHDITGWIYIDEGFGEKYSHAQNYYLDKNIIDDNGNYVYEYVDGEIREKDNTEAIVAMAKTKRISELKRFLSETDYKAIKYAEGEITEEEYAPFKAQRRAWRAEINYIEEEINNG